MKLNVLKNALENYMLCADCDYTDRGAAVEALAEINRLIERFTDRDLQKDEVQIITVNDVMTLLNAATYDIYGKLAADDRGTFEAYAYKVRDLLDVDMTNVALEIGYSFISDLWHDNQEAGCNNPDGTFKYNDPVNGELH
jgi:hypothetical protein